MMSSNWDTATLVLPLYATLSHFKRQLVDYRRQCNQYNVCAFSVSSSLLGNTQQTSCVGPAQISIDYND